MSATTVGPERAVDSLRLALAGLTPRGRSLLVCGVALACSATFLGQGDLLRVAIFLVALPLAAVAVVSRTRYRLSCTRALDPARAPVGAAVDVRLQLDNVSRLPSGVLLLEDTVPYPLGGRPRFVLDRVEAGARREVSYPLRPEARGRYRVGPLSVRLTDPFGLCELSRAFSATDDLLVHPVVSALPPVRLGADWAGGGDTASRSVASSGTDDAATREYRRGDDLRKVHWRSTARLGELMVRREEQPFQSRATLLLDGRLGAHRGHGPGSSYEWSVAAVASIGVALARAGFGLRLLDESGEDLAPPGVALTETVLLDALAGSSPTRTPRLGAALTRLRTGGVDGVLVAVLGQLDPADAEQVARLRQQADVCVAVLVDVQTWGSARERQAYDAGAALLAAQGWRVLRIAAGTDLATVWPLASNRGVGAGSAPAGVPQEMSQEMSA